MQSLFETDVPAAGKGKSDGPRIFKKIVRNSCGERVGVVTNRPRWHSGKGNEDEQRRPAAVVAGSSAVAAGSSAVATAPSTPAPPPGLDLPSGFQLWDPWVPLQASTTAIADPAFWDKVD